MNRVKPSRACRSEDSSPSGRHLIKALGDNSARRPLRATGVSKDPLLVPANTLAGVEFAADHPGRTLLRGHQQNLMDRGFVMLFNRV